MCLCCTILPSTRSVFLEKNSLSFSLVRRELCINLELSGVFLCLSYVKLMTLSGFCSADVIAIDC